MINHPFVNRTVEELRADVERLRQENADLRASALLWKRLYDQVLRAENARLTRAEHSPVLSTSASGQQTQPLMLSFTAAPD